MGINLTFKEKILTKSNSYNYYKQRNDELLEEKENLQKDIDNLKREINSLRFEKMTNLRDEYFRTYKKAGSFCEWSYMSHLLRNDFEDTLKNVTKHLEPEDARKFKLTFARALFVNLVTRNTVYFDEEIARQNQFTEFKLNECGPAKVGKFNFYGNYNLHPFIDLNLTEEEKEFIKDKDIIDAGAFTGDTSLPLSKITDKNVYAFEPFEDSYELLTKNIVENNIANIIPVKKSLGNINGERTLFLSGQNVQGITSDSNIRPYDTEIKVQETTIDAFVEENNLEVGFITIDVEGAEMDLLEGAINTIKTQKPILNISIYHKVSDFFGIIPWIADLDLGYEFKIEKEEPWSFLADTVVKCKVRD